MFTRRLLLALTLLALGAPRVAGQQASIEGRVTDDEGSRVNGAVVTVARDTLVIAGAISDETGAFTVSNLAPGDYTLTAGGLGYADQTRAIRIVPGQALTLDIQLLRSAIALPGISVDAAASRERERFEVIAGPTVREIDIEQLRALPGIAEVDPIRAIEVLPGVVSTSDFSAAFHVRGGSQDQNLILLDGVPVFSPFHLGGLFSVFNADMIDRVELQSGGFPAEHGGRVSSVLDIESNPGEGPFSVQAGVSLLATRVAVGGRLPSGFSSALGRTSTRYRVSARRSYFDVLFKPAFEFPYHLTDFQVVLESQGRSGDRLLLTAYTGKDVLDFTRIESEDFPLRIDWDWGNDLIGLRWIKPHAGGGALDLRANFSRFGTGLSFPDFADTEFTSGIEQAQLRADLAQPLSPRLALQLGASAERQAYANRFATGGTEFGSGDGTGWLLGPYAQMRWSVPNAWLVEAGLRVDTWLPDPGDLDAEVAPRLAVKRFFAGGDAAVKLAAGRYTQFMHSLRDEELPLGIDIWVLAGATAPHVVSDQLQLGVEGFRDIDWYWSVEAYVRSFDGVVTFNPAEDPNDELDDIMSGEGLSYGIDFLVRKETGALNGWMAASVLEAERTFPDPLSPIQPNPEVSYSPVFDRRLDLDLVLRYPAPWGWEGGIRWNFGTGIPYTRAVGSYAFYAPRFVDGGQLQWSGDDSGPVRDYAVVLESRNASRFPTYHRLDLSFRRTFTKGWGTLTPYVNVLNVYNRRNPLFYFFEYDRVPAVRSGVSMFPVLPTFGLEVTF
jgi:hypothetical protein